MKTFGAFLGVSLVGIGLYMLHPGLPLVIAGACITASCHERRPRR